MDIAGAEAEARSDLLDPEKVGPTDSHTQSPNSAPTTQASNITGISWPVNEDEEEEGVPPPAWVLAMQRGWYSFKSSFMTIVKRPGAVKAFLKAVKEGDTTEALCVLANNPFLLAYGTFAGDGDTVWHLLAEFGDTALLQAFINFCKIHPPKRRKPKREGETNSDNIILELVNMGNDLKQTPLMFAAYHGRDDVIAFLLKQGADPWASDRCGRRTALHYACMKGYAACVNALLDNMDPEDEQDKEGCRYVNVKTASGFTPLHFAVAANCLPAVRALLMHDARIDEFNMFDAGEFWISCATKSTALHVAATSNRLHCAMAILQYYSESRKRLSLEDPRCWCDKKGRTPQEVAQLKKNTELAALLEPGSRIEEFSYAALGVHDASRVPKLQSLAAKAVKAQLLASIQEAEEYMKLLGTHQTHGRVFARLAYDSGQSQQRLSTASSVPDSRSPPLYDPYAASLSSPDSLLNAMSSGRSTLTMLEQRSVHRSSIAQGEGSGKTNSTMTGLSSITELGSRDKERQQAPGSKEKDARQTAIKQWLSYERKADAAGVKNVRQTPLKERSTLSQINPGDAEGTCFAGMLRAVGLQAKPVYLLPSPGEDVCGICHDNKPLLQIQFCGHKTCLLCAKSMCYMLDLNQLALCPYCGSLVSSFGLA